MEEKTRLEDLDKVEEEEKCEMDAHGEVIGGETEAEEKDQRKNRLKEFLSYLIPIALAVILANLLNNYVIINARIPSGSMENTIQIGDRLIGYRLAYKNSDPQRGDIIMFTNPDDDSEILIKRIIGMPGEVVDIVDGVVYIDGEVLEEDYLKEDWVDRTGPYHYEVPEDCYFVMGDNRNNSADARVWTNTYVTRDSILGKAVFRYYPFSSFGSLKED